MDIKINQNSFKIQKKLSQLENYNNQGQIGIGGSGVVSRVIDHNGHKRALKKIPKYDNQTDIYALNEIKILQQLDHPNILKLYEFYEYPNEYCIITDFWEGGDLYEYLGNHQKFQQHIAEIMRQLFSVIKFAHDKNIIHRDIKSENILIQDSNDGLLIKLIDWGINQV